MGPLVFGLTRRAVAWTKMLMKTRASGCVVSCSPFRGVVSQGQGTFIRSTAADKDTHRLAAVVNVFAHPGASQANAAEHGQPRGPLSTR